MKDRMYIRIPALIEEEEFAREVITLFLKR